jgi:hypothetical protein
MSIATNAMERAVKTIHRSTMPATMSATPLQDYAAMAHFGRDDSENPASRAVRDICSIILIPTGNDHAIPRCAFQARIERIDINTGLTSALGCAQSRFFESAATIS